MAHVITLVTGPPCGGKSTYVGKHAGPDDQVVCFDLLARSAGSRHPHVHNPSQRAAAAQAYEDALRNLAASTPERDVWVIRCAPTAAERQALARRIHADQVLVLAPSMAVALRRAQKGGRERRTGGVIRGWYRAYRPADGEQRITGDRPTW